MTNSPYIVDITMDNFQSEVLEGSMKQPVLVDFWAEWCQPCKTLMPLLEKLAGEYRGAFRLARVNCDEQQAIAAQVGVRSLPTVILVSQGQVLDQFTGALPEGELRRFLEQHVEPPQADPLEQAREYLAAGEPEAAVPLLEALHGQRPDDQDVALELAHALMQAGELDRAEAIVADLPDEARHDPRCKGIKARRAFAEQLAGLPDREALAARVEQDPHDSEARHGLALHQVLTGEHEAALEHLLWIVRHDRPWDNDRGKETLLAVFDLLGADDPLVRQYRSRLFQSLY